MGSRQIQPEDFGLSQQQFDEIKGVFDHFDTDASGRLLRLRRFGRTNSDFLAQVPCTHKMSLLQCVNWDSSSRTRMKFST